MISAIPPAAALLLDLWWQ